MKTLTKTFGTSLIFMLTFLAASFTPAKAECRMDDCLSSTTDTLSAEEVEEEQFDFDFTDPFFFNDQVVVYIYNKSDELLFKKSYSPEEAKNDQELKALLKKSNFMLSVDDRHFYYLQN